MRTLAGKLGSLLGQGTVTLYAYRWAVVDTPPTTDPAPGSNPAAVSRLQPATHGARAAGLSPPPPQPTQQAGPGQEACLLRGLASLGMLLMGPLPEGLPPCDMLVADPTAPAQYRATQASTFVLLGSAALGCHTRQHNMECCCCCCCPFCRKAHDSA